MKSASDLDAAVRRVGRYVIYGELASGGMATVHLGRLTGPAGFSKTVAVKRLHPHLANEPEFAAMLIEEAKLASLVQHPNVVSSLDVVYEEDELLLVMEYVEGETLARLLGYSRRGLLHSPGVSVVVRVLTDVLAGLHAAHTARTHHARALNIVHRDVSPQNIMVGVDGIARVLDFGVAKAEHARHVTRPGRIKGKLAYMSPEHVRGRPLDARADVFGVGVVLWECLTRRRLFAADDWHTASNRLRDAAVPPPSVHDAELSPELDRIALRALARDPDARFSSAAEFADALASAVRPSNSVDVGRWVSATARGTLLERARLLVEIEASTLTEARPPEPRGGRANLTTVVDGLRKPRGRRHHAPAWLGAALLLLVGLGAVVVSRAPARERERNAEAAAETPIARAAPAAPSAQSLVVPSIEAASLDLASRPEPSADVERRKTIRASSPVTARLPVRKVSLKRHAAKPKAPSCETPFRLDEHGIRRVRRECL